MKLIRDFMKECADEMDEMLGTVVSSNNIDYIDEDLVDKIFSHYVYCKIKSYIWFLLSVIASAMVTVCIISQNVSPNLPHPVRIILPLAIIFRIPMNKAQIRDYIMEGFGKDAVELFKNNRDLWHAINNDSKEE